MLLLAEPIHIRDTQLQDKHPADYNTLVHKFGPGEFNGEINLLPPWEVQGYASYFPKGEVASQLDSWYVFANNNDGSALAWRLTNSIHIGWIQPHCEKMSDVISLDIFSNWLDIIQDARLKPNGLENPYFIPRGTLQGRERYPALMDGKTASEGHSRLLKSFVERNWIVLRSSRISHHTLTRIGKESIGVVTVKTIDPEFVTGAFDSEIIIHADSKVITELSEEIVSIFIQLGWLFD